VLRADDSPVRRNSTHGFLFSQQPARAVTRVPSWVLPVLAVVMAGCGQPDSFTRTERVGAALEACTLDGATTAGLQGNCATGFWCNLDTAVCQSGYLPAGVAIPLPGGNHGCSDVAAFSACASGSCNAAHTLCGCQIDQDCLAGQTCDQGSFDCRPIPAGGADAAAGSTGGSGDSGGAAGPGGTVGSGGGAGISGEAGSGGTAGSVSTGGSGGIAGSGGAAGNGGTLGSGAAAGSGGAAGNGTGGNGGTSGTAGHCANDSECSNQQYCTAQGECAGKKDVGIACTANHECVDSYCGSGYCTTGFEYAPNGGCGCSYALDADSGPLWGCAGLLIAASIFWTRRGPGKRRRDRV
jgi:hypothetical protein